MDPGITLTIGLILGAGTICGAAVRLLRLPALTGYIVAGVLLGEHVLHALPEHDVESLSGPVFDFAMALVLFSLGGQFRAEKLKGQTMRLISAALLESCFTIGLVGLATWPVLGDPRPALLLGVLGVAVAPATTLVVLKELRAQGPLSDRITLLTGLSNLITVILFEVVLLLLLAFQVGGPESGGAWDIAWDLAGSLLLGLLAGHALILLQVRLGRGNTTLPLLTVIFLTIGIAQWQHIPHMLAFLVTGSVVANRSRLFEPITGSMDLFAKPAYVAFFVLGGLHIDFLVFQEVGWVIGVYVTVRTLGKVVGTRLAGNVAGLPLRSTQQAGPGLLCQAGAAIALAAVAGRYDPELSERLLNVILGGVAVFELAGPVLLRAVAIASGEVPMGQLLVHARRDNDGTDWWSAALRTLRGRRAPRGADLERLCVADLVRPDAASLPVGAGLAEVLRFADHSPYNHFPVVDDSGRLAGVIPLSGLDEVVYDPKLAGLVIAEDLIEHSPDESSLPADATLAEAAGFFQGFPGNTAAIVKDRESRQFVGMLPRSEVLLLARHLPESHSG